MNHDFDFQLGSFCDSERTQAAVRPSFLTSLSSIYITMTRGKHWEGLKQRREAWSDRQLLVNVNQGNAAVQSLRWRPWLAEQNTARYPYFYGQGKADVRIVCRDGAWYRTEEGAV